MSDYTPTMGSLFSGIGGFELPAIWHGAKVLWQSEIEPWAVELLKKHFPDAKQLGDISKICGRDIPPVDFITFGSPCQDMSIAGKRAGLDGERSGLFRQAIRIIREMREATNGEYPHFAIWENVPGALSSHKGLDFKAVLEEITETQIPMPDSGRWATAGMVRGGAADISWRVLDAQYWGVSQRRKRIYLVADYRTERSAEILFKPEGVSRYPAPGKEPWQGTAADIEACIGKTGNVKCYDIGEARRRNPQEYDNICPAILASWGEGGNNVAAVAYRICSYASNCMKSDNPNSGIYQTEKSSTLDLNGGNPACNQGGIALCIPLYCLQGNMIGRKDENGPQGDGISENVCYTLTAVDVHGVCIPMAADLYNDALTGDTAATVTNNTGISATHSGPSVMVPIVTFEPGIASRCGGHIDKNISATLRANMGDNQIAVCIPVAYDARGNGNGVTVPTITGDHNSRVTDYTAVACMPVYVRATQQANTEVMVNNSPTVTAVAGMSGNNQPVACIQMDAIDRAAYNQGQNAQFDISIKDDGVMQTVVAKGPNAVAHPKIYSFYPQMKAESICFNEDTANTMVNGTNPGFQNGVLIPVVYCLRERCGCEGGGKGALIQENKSGTLACNNDQTVFIPVSIEYIVRRLTPSECAKLQGFPADWHENITNEKGKPLPDTAAYKGYGNAVATVCAEYPITNIIEILKEEHALK